MFEERFQPQKWKPKAKTVLSIHQLPLQRELIVQVKADGEFTVVNYQRNATGSKVFSVNLWGTMRGEAYPWLRELKEALDKLPLSEVTLLAETYGVEGERMLKLPDVIHHLKNGDPEKIRLGVHDVVSVNNATVNRSYIWRLQEVDVWLKGLQRVHVLPYIQPRSHKEVEEFWREWVEGKGYEGLFARDNHQDLYKVKPYFSIDGVVIGYNKKERLEKGEITSLRVALRDQDGSYVYVTDVASGIDAQLRKRLYETLKEFKVKEYQDWVQVQSFIIVEVQATDVFKAQRPRYLYREGFLEPAGTVNSYSLRHPRLIRFRRDKTISVDDVRLSQLPN